ncbi:single-stranded DNA-binding protein [Cellulosilyticum lentocellum]|uniref:Single-strand binding protein/Primosomal replication protein n n=2 Tax=Cellulosilyticum TaxID=698776 RepID=F2JMK5_CELLD|nr:single-stranded DNA-binding protein [Cellulosilyticum lentocellum]ADZ84656.1 single-strand binding protein/Primosomal replication protein n [Cellulosilyticum lentocellum DSM 5427]
MLKADKPVKEQIEDKERVGMVEHILENNEVVLIGKVVSDIKFSHKVYGEGFYTFELEVPRLSSSADILPVTISERILPSIGNVQGKVLEVLGQFRSYNQYEEGKNRLILTVFILEVKEVSEQELAKNKNYIYLNGYVCKEPIYRTTPFGREITDLLLAVNRSYHKSDYIPCITWGRNARFAQNLAVGDHIQVWGRIQSRIYQKKLETGDTATKIAYEISISKMETVDENGNSSSSTEVLEAE